MKKYQFLSVLGENCTSPNLVITILKMQFLRFSSSSHPINNRRQFICKSSGGGCSTSSLKHFSLSFLSLCFISLFVASGFIGKCDGQGFGFHYPSFSIPMSLPTTNHGFLYPTPYSYEGPPPMTRYTSLMSKLKPKQINLPSMSRVSETLGALGTLARRFLNRQNVEAEGKSEEQELVTSASQNNYFQKNYNINVSSTTATVFKVKPEDDPELNDALYTLSRNVLGRNVTESLVPIVKSVNQMGRFLPPLIYRDGRIILGTGNATKDGGSIKDAVCTTPGGHTGKCLDISGCPSLLLDLQKLRKSLCFKALFVPGVCCPDKPEDETIPVTSAPSTRRPQTVTTSTRRPSNFGTNPTRLPPPFMTESPLNRQDMCGRPENPSFRIVGGEKSTPGNWPWMAAIFLHGPKGTEFWCGGTLISKKYVLTAAHCTKDQKQKSFSPRQFTVRLGDYDLMKTDDPSSPESYKVVKIKAHPDFNGVGFYNDVALLELEREVDYNRFISPICLPTARSKFNTFVGTFPTVIGWGTNKYGGREHTALQEVKLPVWTNTECDRAYFQPITQIFLCAGYREGGRDACQGGPLMLEESDGKWMQIGIVSFGNRCAEPGYPGVYTRLTEFMEWIKTNAI